MNSKIHVTLIMLAAVLTLNVGMAQTAPSVSTKPAAKTQSAQTAAKNEAVISRPLSKASPELKRAYGDKKFLAACEILAADGEMFLADTARISRTGEKFSITFKVVTEKNQAVGEYKQLVYSFDGKASSVSFNEKNDKYAPVFSPSAKNLKLKWPPAWWPGSGTGTIGIGGGTSWGEWQPKSIDNCHFNFPCSPFHVGKMREEERISNSNTSVKQTRWILIYCGCS